MKNLQAVIRDMQVGRSVTVDQIQAAANDLAQAEALIASIALDGLVVVESPQITDQDQTIRHLGEMYMLFQSLVLEMRAKGALEMLQGDIGDKMSAAKQHLLIHRYEPARLGRLDALKLRPVTFEKPPEPPTPPYREEDL